MKIRRVVTAKNALGKSVVVSDGSSPREVVAKHTPGFVSSPQWVTAATPVLPYDGKDPINTLETLVPPPGGSTFLVVTFAPDSVMKSADPKIAGPERRAASPGIAETFEKDNPGMHTMQSVDYACILSGEMWLELDDGELVHLRQGDTVVQIGARHKWRNHREQPATVAFVMMGAIST
jgi:mannose-6-phosphate isomerase-like protein (cupin superfamily)